jgi:uncharacterized protein (DUF1697 family)
MAFDGCSLLPEQLTIVQLPGGCFMSVHVALLRGINVGGHNKIAMAELRDLCGDVGLTGATSLLQSGNLVFQSDGVTGADLEHLLEVETARRLNVSVEYVVRSAKEWAKIVARNPFSKEAKDDPAHLVVMVLKTAPTAKRLAALQAVIQGPEVVRGDGKQLYIVYPEGIGRSKLTGTVIEKQLCSRGTARNWNTVLKLAAFCPRHGTATA